MPLPDMMLILLISQLDLETVKKQLEETHANQVQWEKTAKSAEVKLDLQVAQHNKAVETLRKELAALQETAKLEDTVADLQDRNTEMEELLKAKCQEIEENDDRFIKSVACLRSTMAYS